MRVKKLMTYHTDKKGRQTLREGVQADLIDKTGNLTIKGQTAFLGAVNNPIWHRPLDLGIKEFKRFVNKIPMITKSQINEQVRLYKNKSWSEYDKTIKFKGTFPTVRI